VVRKKNNAQQERITRNRHAPSSKCYLKLMAATNFVCGRWTNYARLKSRCIKRIQHSVHSDNSGWCRLVTFRLVTSALELMSLSFFAGVKNVLCAELMSAAVQRGLTTPSMRICDLCVFLRALQRVRVLSKASLSYEWSIEAELFVAVILCCDYTCTWDTVRR